jgi:hypothetical protein
MLEQRALIVEQLGAAVDVEPDTVGRVGGADRAVVLSGPQRDAVKAGEVCSGSASTTSGPGASERARVSVMPGAMPSARAAASTAAMTR